MPHYDYACPLGCPVFACSFTGDHQPTLQTCPKCGAPARRAHATLVGFRGAPSGSSARKDAGSQPRRAAPAARTAKNGAGRVVA